MRPGRVPRRWPRRSAAVSLRFLACANACRSLLLPGTSLPSRVFYRVPVRGERGIRRDSALDTQATRTYRPPLSEQCCARIRAKPVGGRGTGTRRVTGEGDPMDRRRFLTTSSLLALSGCLWNKQTTRSQLAEADEADLCVGNVSIFDN